MGRAFRVIKFCNKQNLPLLLTTLFIWRHDDATMLCLERTKGKVLFGRVVVTVEGSMQLVEVARSRSKHSLREP